MPLHRERGAISLKQNTNKRKVSLSPCSLHPYPAAHVARRYCCWKLRDSAPYVIIYVLLREQWDFLVFFLLRLSKIICFGLSLPSTDRLPARSFPFSASSVLRRFFNISFQRRAGGPKISQRERERERAVWSWLANWKLTQLMQNIGKSSEVVHLQKTACVEPATFGDGKKNIWLQYLDPVLYLTLSPYFSLLKSTAKYFTLLKEKTGG